MGIISEGVSDLISSVKDCIINRDFEWGKWGIQKWISFTVSIAMAGMSWLKEWGRVWSELGKGMVMFGKEG